MQIRDVATEAEMTAFSHLMRTRHRGHIALRFMADGVEAEVATHRSAPAAHLAGRLRSGRPNGHVTSSDRTATFGREDHLQVGSSSARTSE
jgi:hypothetical protein